MVFTLHRYIFRDLLKTFFLATLILSAVLGLGFMLRPLREFSVEPVRVPELLLYTLPITLTMVIPIAALLAATLTYGRLAFDNEINACRSSGISLHNLIYPALTLALFIGIVTLLLGFHIIPIFTERFESIIKTDAEAIIYKNIEKKGNLGKMFSEYRVHADYAIPAEHRLVNVVVLELDRSKIKRIITARHVEVNFKTRQQSNEIHMRLLGASVLDPNSNTSTDWDSLTLSVTAPRFLQDSIKFKKLGDLKKIRRNMLLFEPIRKQFDKTRRQILVENFFQYCSGQLSLADGYLDLYQGGHRLRLSGNQQGLQVNSCKGQRAEFGGKGEWPVVLGYYHEAGDVVPEKIYFAREVQIKIDPQNISRPVELILQDARWNYANETHRYSLKVHPLAAISLPDGFVEELEAITLGSLLAEGNVGPGKGLPSAYLGKLLGKLRRDCHELGIEIAVELHSRLAFGLSCIVLVLMGTALGIVFRSSHLLTAFGISFVPAALCLITIFTGKHIAEQSNSGVAGGIFFLWSGIAVVFIADLLLYRKLLKQ